MSTERQSVTVRDLVEEAKKRVVFLIICAIGLSYLMSHKYDFYRNILHAEESTRDPMHVDRKKFKSSLFTRRIPVQKNKVK
uniref:Phox (PX) domain-containing protein n=1 Tax=Solanum tuberosum TaxID=4113 RepID=M1ACA2_SOLTU